NPHFCLVLHKPAILLLNSVCEPRDSEAKILLKKPRATCRPVTVTGRHCPWEPTALHDFRATTRSPVAVTATASKYPYGEERAKTNLARRIPFVGVFRLRMRDKEDSIQNQPLTFPTAPRDSSTIGGI